MRDTDVFGVLLGLDTDWSVSEVDLTSEPSTVRLVVKHVGKARCPECSKVCGVHDHSALRSWRHLDTMQYITLVVSQVPRTNCSEHGVKQIKVPWAGPKSRFTELFEALAIRILELTRCQFRTATLLRLSQSQVHDLMQRAVARGLGRRTLEEVPHASIDEKSFHRGHRYATILCDVLQKRVVEVTEGRDEKAGKLALKGLPHPEKVQTITMDMSASFMSAARSELPGADLIHDRFHIAAMLGKAVDETRRSEVKRSPELERTRYLWLKNPENLNEKQKLVFDVLVKTELKTAEAYAFKQIFKGFFEQDDVPSAEIFFKHWMEELKKKSLKKMLGVAKTLESHLQGLLNYVKWKLTNGYAEAVNGLIQEIKTVARGFRKFENFRVAILFFLGKLDLNPRNSP